MRKNEEGLRVLQSAGGINYDILYTTVYDYSNVHPEDSPHQKNRKEI